MKTTSRLLFTAVLWILSTAAVMAQESASLAGVVTDASTTRPLFGANVIVSTSEGDVMSGVASDEEGRFLVQDIPAGDYVVQIQFISYLGFEMPITLNPGETRTINALLTPDNVSINTIVVSASRRDEKVLDAPASISVIDARELEQEVGFSTISILRRTMGVDLAQTSLDRSQISLRGFNAANINSNVFLLNDYRPAVGSEGVAFYSIMSSSSVDLERIEVVRGPASALYGAGGDTGVLHFITKDPFRYPGTTVSLTSGERSTFAGQYRHAGVIGERLGYKVTASYKQADEWAYDPADPVDALFLGQENTQRDYTYSKTNLDGMVQYRRSEDFSMTINGGYSELTGFLLTDLAPFQVKEMLGLYGQFRFQAGNFFAQTYANMRDAGESFAYTAVRPIVQEGGRYGAQVQYDQTTTDGRTRFIVGADADLIRLESDRTLTGRNESVDNINLLGGYVQTSLDISEVVDLTIALRGDWSNVYEGFQLSPRAALLVKPSPYHTFRASVNSAFAAPTTFQFFLDFVIQEQALNADSDFLVMGRGAAESFTFNGFREQNAARMLLPVDGFLGNDYAVDALPLVPIYGAAAAGGLVDYLQSGAPLPVEGLTAEQRGLLADLLGYTSVNGSLGSEATGAAVLGLPDDSDRGYQAVGAPLDTRPLEQTTTQTAELGYKGIWGKSTLISIDLYYANKKNLVGPLSLRTPFVYLQGEGLTADLNTTLQNVFATTGDPGLQNLLTQLEAAGMPAAQAAGLLAGLVGGAMGDQSIAVVQTDQAILQPGTANAIGAMATFQNFGDVDYWGADVSLEVIAADHFTFFGNLSVVSDDLFDSEELGEEDPNLELALNAPTFKTRFGGDYQFRSGLSFNASGRYTKGFPVRSGTLFGEVDSYWVFDAGAGFDFERSIPGLRLDVSVQNLLDHRHRQFVGAPKIGRVGLARLTYTFD